MGRYTLPAAGAIEFTSDVLSGDSLARSAAQTAGSVGGGIAGGAVGGFACGTETIATLGVGSFACPVLIGGLGAVDSFVGNKIGGAIANVFGW